MTTELQEQINALKKETQHEEVKNPDGDKEYHHEEGEEGGTR